MNIILFHGTSGSPQHFWFPWLKTELEKAGHIFIANHYEDMNRTPINEFLPKVLKDISLTEDTILVSHSSGGPFILSVLEQSKVKVFRAILVAGFCSELPGDKNVILQSSYDWEAIRKNANSFVFINSDNDPW